MLHNNGRLFNFSGCKIPRAKHIEFDMKQWKAVFNPYRYANMSFPVRKLFLAPEDISLRLQLKLITDQC